MKKIYVLSMAILALGAQNALAQDFNDTDAGSHLVNINVPTIAAIDVEGATTANEANDNQVITFDLEDIIDPAAVEAGLGFENYTQTINSLWLNYTSILPSGVASRDVTVHIDDRVNIPQGFKLELQTGTQTITNGNAGTSATGTAIAWTYNSGPLVAAPQNVMEGLSSVYTGDGPSKGVQLVYTLSTDPAADFEDLVAGTYTAEFTYTLSDN